MNNKQRWMGGVVLLGGGVLLAALLLKGQDEINQDRQQNPAQAAEVENKETGNHSLGSLTVDVETEKRLLEQQRRDREKSVAEQEARAAEFLAMQQQAEADAARKAAEEYAALNAHRLG
ncbi:MAG: cell division protein, partial [Acinetobacter sp.]|nr:cell division protein [Acinetobacter sp.]